MMSDSDWSAKPRVIGEIERGDHYHLEPDDRCLFFGEYTSRAGFDHGDTNQLISNLQKPVSRAGKPDYKYKEWAISTAAAAIRGASAKATRGEVVIVSARPTKPRRSAPTDGSNLIVSAMMVVAPARAASLVGVAGPPARMPG